MPRSELVGFSVLLQAEIYSLHAVTEQLVRKRAEHNEGDIASLEELSLHQQELEKYVYDVDGATQ